MGNCCSTTSTGPSSYPPTGHVPQQSQSDGQALEQQDLSLPVSPQGRDATLKPANSVPPGGSIPAPTPSQSDGKASQSLLPKPGRSRSISSPHYSSRSNFPHLSYDSARVGPTAGSGGETSQKPSLTSSRSRIMSSPHNASG